MQAGTLDHRARSRNRAKFMAAAAAVAGSIVASNASAGLTYDLRFADGSHVKQADTTTYTLDLWARISGTNGTVTDEAVTNSYITILSSQSGGGAFTLGGLTAGAPAPGFNEAGSRSGGPNQLNGDGIVDWELPGGRRAGRRHAWAVG
jgi:hypothetical protein